MTHAASPQNSPHHRSLTPYLIFLAIALGAGFAALIVRNAWLSDDAYITFRTVDNVIYGYGPTWNVAERVQTYTHPLWMFLLALAGFFTREVYFTSLGLSLALSLATAALLATRVARSPGLACVGLAALALSKAYVDYATSGLENALTHLLLILFIILYLETETLDLRRYGWLCFLAALGMLNRLDTFLLYAPALLYGLLRLRDLKAVGVGLLGATPILLWELFSLVYYGFLFPNTAYAKLNAGLIARQDLWREGAFYLLNSFRADPLTLTLIVLGAALPLAAREWRRLPLAAGALLYVAYVVNVGGDFMSGRFFTAPFLLATVLLVSAPWATRVLYCGGLAAVVVGVGLSAPYSPLWAGGEIGGQWGEAAWITGRSIDDERATYYRNTGLVRALAGAPLPDHDWALEGRAARAGGPAVIVKGSVGFFGYFAGPEVHVVDILGLGDPLLARLPPTDPQWAIGHFGRALPEGYLETLTTGENRLADPDLASYYDALRLATRGDLFAPQRWAAIWGLHTGAYDAHLDAYAFARDAVFERRYRVTNPTDHAYIYAYVWNNGAAAAYLLDAASTRGATYDIGWRIAAAETTFTGSYVEQSAWRGPLADTEPLNVGLFFRATPDSDVQEMYEYRYWFRLDAQGAFTVVLPPQAWHKAASAAVYWAPADLREVMTALP